MRNVEAVYWLRQNKNAVDGLAASGDAEALLVQKRYTTAMKKKWSHASVADLCACIRALAEAHPEIDSAKASE